MTRIHDKSQNRYRPAEPVIRASGSASIVELRSTSPTKSTHFGTMSLAPLPGALKVLTIENANRRRFSGVGRQLLAMAENIRQQRQLPSTTLLCQDEGAAEFFFKKGFRFSGHDAEAKNAAMHAHLDAPDSPIPDDCIFLGEMRKP
ncbi:GNAT family N-acetyltransferase [Acidovorax sp. SUPP1855]|uniref:GNAT family N-acetyltransferase n=1 Tax=Acidovorax sp. SUPP1855 TaxID=431774 RepID=UPI0023DE5B39|nr:GNAT family N-acetyltransferase [Acidovorax sp. SUPP1855]GKS85220.1 GNAT family N-acetyltransferase [Acidovorax sp. SUPP1855]